MILGGTPQTKEVDVVSLDPNVQVPQCLRRLNPHPELMEFQAAAVNLGKFLYSTVVKHFTTIFLDTKLQLLVEGEVMASNAAFSTQESSLHYHYNSASLLLCDTHI